MVSKGKVRGLSAGMILHSIGLLVGMFDVRMIRGVSREIRIESRTETDTFIVNLRSGPDPYNRSERLNPNPKTCEIAILYGPKVLFCDRNSAVRIRIFHKFHKRFQRNKRRFFCFNIL